MTTPRSGKTPEFHPLHFRGDEVIVSVVRDGERGISTADMKYILLDREAFRWLVETAGPYALSTWDEEAGA